MALNILYVFTYSPNVLLSIHYVPRTLLGAGDRVPNKAGEVPVLVEPTCIHSSEGKTGK